jgi:hypothetical protein
MAAIWSTIWPLLLGVIGYILASFVGSPVRRLFDLSNEVRRQMHYRANVTVPKREPLLGADDGVVEFQQKQERLEEAQKVFRDLGAQLIPFGETERLACFVLRMFRIDPELAGRGLIGLSNELPTYSVARGAFRRQIEEALRIRAET